MNNEQPNCEITSSQEPSVDSKVVNEQWLTIILEEYKTLRTEISTAIANQKTTLSFSVIALGTTLSLAMNSQTKDDYRFWSFSVLIPTLAFAFYNLHAIEFQRMVRAGSYIRINIEEEIKSKFTQSSVFHSPLGWEIWLNNSNQGKKNRLSYYSAIPAIFVVIIMFSMLMAILLPQKERLCTSEVNRIIPCTSIPLIICTFLVGLIIRTSIELKDMGKVYDSFLRNLNSPAIDESN